MQFKNYLADTSVPGTLRLLYHQYFLQTKRALLKKQSFRLGWKAVFALNCDTLGANLVPWVTDQESEKEGLVLPTENEA